MFGCVKKAIMLVGDTSTQVSSKRREQGLTKLNPVLAFWGKEDFLYSGKQLFADGLYPAYNFALKQRILLPTPRKLVTPFFVALPPEGSTGVSGWQKSIQSPLPRLLSAHIKLPDHKHII